MWRPLLLLAALLTDGCALSNAREDDTSAASRRTAAGISSVSTARAGRRQLAPAVATGLPLPPDWRSEVTNDTQASVLKKAASPEGVVIFTTFALPGREEAMAAGALVHAALVAHARLLCACKHAGATCGNAPALPVDALDHW